MNGSCRPWCRITRSSRQTLAQAGTNLHVTVLDGESAMPASSDMSRAVFMDKRVSRQELFHFAAAAEAWLSRRRGDGIRDNGGRSISKLSRYW